jgi:DNA segregation ATPase FtsK/SpoIIIE-like protein
MEQLEKAGIVGSLKGAKPREVMISDEQALEVILASL